MAIHLDITIRIPIPIDFIRIFRLGIFLLHQFPSLPHSNSSLPTIMFLPFALKFLMPSLCFRILLFFRITKHLTGVSGGIGVSCA